jgi:predicted dehydrogenase
MVFHGDKGFIEIRSPFNAGLYEHHKIELHNQNHTQATVMRFPGTQQYRLEVETFARAALGSGERVFTLEESILNQKVIDAIFAAGDKGGWRTCDQVGSAAAVTRMIASTSVSPS